MFPWLRTVVRNKYLDTNIGWILFSVGMFIGAIAFHHAALAFELYGNPPHPDLRIDVYTHSASSFSVVALLFNFNLSRQKSRWYTWGIPIAGAFVIGVAWELFEEFVIRMNLVAFYNSFWNAMQDLYMDVLGGIAAAFLVDEIVP